MTSKEKANQRTEKINPQTEELADLPATDEQAQQAKGGPLNYSKIEFVYTQHKSDGTLN